MTKIRPVPSADLAALEEALLALEHDMMIEWVDGEDEEGAVVAGLTLSRHARRTSFPRVTLWEDGDLALETAEGEQTALETFLLPIAPASVAARMWDVLVTSGPPKEEA